MESPGQRRGLCGHKIGGFDKHDKCARCRDKGLVEDPCIVGGAICTICNNFTAIQREMLATPQYQIRKDKNAGLLVSPRDVTVLSPVNSTQQQGASSAHVQQTISEDSNAHVQHLPGGSDNVSSSEFVSKKDFDKLSDQLDERFSRFEALLSRGNIFATPKMPVQVKKPQVSDQPFIDPSSARATGPVRSPALQESGSDGKPKDKKKHKSSHQKSSKTKPAPVGEATGPVQETVTDTSHQQTKPVPVGESTGPVQGTDTFPQKEPVPVVSGSLTSPEPVALTREPIMGICRCLRCHDRC